MYKQSPIEEYEDEVGNSHKGREFSAFVLSLNGKTYFYLNKRNTNVKCQSDNQKISKNSYTNIGGNYYKVIVQIHTHNSCNRFDDYQGPSHYDYNFMKNNNVPVITIGRTDVSYINPNRWYGYNPKKYFLNMKKPFIISANGIKVTENRLKMANTSVWLENPKYEY